LRLQKPIRSNDYLENLSEFEAILEMNFTHESGPSGGQFDEKN
jgi:hypothetical protein